jgi:hypothetical protein
MSNISNTPINQNTGVQQRHATSANQVSNIQGLSANPRSPTTSLNTNSTPFVAMGEDQKAFAKTFEAVLKTGVLSQNELRNNGQSFSASHDGSQGNKSEICVTRIPQALGGRSEEMATHALTAPYFGGLTVGLERGKNELGTQAPKTMSPDEMRQKHPEYASESNETLQMLANAMKSTEQLKLDPNGTNEASKRLENTFVVLANAAQPSSANRPTEQNRASIKPQEMTAVIVPEKYKAIAMQVADKVGFDKSKIQVAENTATHAEFSPDYRTAHGKPVNTEGVTAPDYRPMISKAVQNGDVDQHLVKV